jgi:hypothetical protein
MGTSLSVRLSGYSFGSVRVDGVTYDHDLIIDRGKIRKRKKGASRQFRGAYGHTPLSAAEDIPWRCLWVPETLSPHATWAYSWRRPPSLSRRMTLTSSAMGSGSARSGLAWFSARCCGARK